MLQNCIIVYWIWFCRSVSNFLAGDPLVCVHKLYIFLNCHFSRFLGSTLRSDDGGPYCAEVFAWCVLLLFVEQGQRTRPSSGNFEYFYLCTSIFFGWRKSSLTAEISRNRERKVSKKMLDVFQKVCAKHFFWLELTRTEGGNCVNWFKKFLTRLLDLQAIMTMLNFSNVQKAKIYQLQRGKSK